MFYLMLGLLGNKKIEINCIIDLIYIDINIVFVMFLLFFLGLGYYVSMVLSKNPNTSSPMKEQKWNYKWKNVHIILLNY
jgi:hypothetical protein